MKGASASPGLGRVPGTEQVLNKCTSQAPHSATPGGLQESKGYKRQAGLGFCGPGTPCVGTELQGQRDTPLSPA